MPNGKDVVNFPKKKILTPSMAIRFYYISSVHNQVFRV